MSLLLPSEPKLVLDTNVLVAAMRSRNGASYQLLAAVRQRRVRLLVSVPLMVEYEAVLQRPEHRGPRSPLLVEQFIGVLCQWAQPVELHFRWRPQARDPGDDMVLETALNGAAHALVTFNVRDMAQAAARFGLPLLTPAHTIDLL